MANTVDTMAPEVLLRKIIDGSLEEFEDSTITEMAGFRFAYCRSLQELSLPNLAMIPDNAFWYCTGLFANILTGIETIGGSAFSRAGNFDNTILVFPDATTISGRANFDRGNFKALDFGEGISALPSDCIYHNTGAQTVDICILRKKDGIVNVPSAASIYGLRNAYVPEDLISAYQTGTNWATRYAAERLTFLPIEGSEYENYYADGTPILSGGGITNRYILDLTIRLLTLFAKGVMAYG